MLEISKVAYELYKQDWVDQHTTALARLKNIREYYAYVAECEEFGDEPDSYEDWLFDYGYHGALYACFGEFCDEEYHDVEYIKGLLGNDEELVGKYLEDIEVGYEEEDLAVVEDALDNAESRSYLSLSQEQSFGDRKSVV